jgi:hypothetical protein
MAVGVYDTWVTVHGSGLPGTADGTRGWIVLAAAVTAAAVSWFKRAARSAGAYSAACGVVALAACAYDRAHLGDMLGGGSVVTASAGAGWGLDLAFAASVSLVAAGAIWLVTQASLPWRWL